MNKTIKQTIDNLRVIDDGTDNSYNHWRAKLEPVILSLNNKEEFEYFFNVYMNSGFDYKSPSAVTDFLNFFKVAPDFVIKIILQLVVDGDLHNNWSVLLLRNKRELSNEIFDLWYDCYKCTGHTSIIEQEKYLNIFTEPQIRKLVEKQADCLKEWFAASMMFSVMVKANIEKFEFMRNDLDILMYELTTDEFYLSDNVKDIFIF